MQLWAFLWYSRVKWKCRWIQLPVKESSVPDTESTEIVNLLQVEYAPVMCSTTGQETSYISTGV